MEFEAKIRIKEHQKMCDDVVEIVQLMKDRVVDLNSKVNALLDAEQARLAKGDETAPIVLKENALYRNYVQIADYIVQSMSSQLPVLRAWSILFRMLRDADTDEERQKERNMILKQSNNANAEDEVEEMAIKHHIDEDGQTILCYLILSCVKSVCKKLDEEVRNMKAKRGRKAVKVAEEERQAALEELTECILPYLSALLNIYQADVFKLYPLIKLISIRAFDGVRQQNDLNQILDALKVIFARHDAPLIALRENDCDESEDGDEEMEVTDDMSQEALDEIEQ